MRGQKLPCDLFCEDRMVFKVENVHGVLGGNDPKLCHDVKNRKCEIGHQNTWESNRGTS